MIPYSAIAASAALVGAPSPKAWILRGMPLLDDR
jgi:hypothetical protein